MNWLPDLLIVLGWLGIVTGLWLVSVPAALAIGGALLLIGGGLLARVQQPEKTRPQTDAGG